MGEPTTIQLGSGLKLALLLFFIFMVMKLAPVGSVASWSWWAVSSPIWVAFLLRVALGMLSKIMEKAGV